MNCYIDASAFVKLLGHEPESEALLAWLADEQPSLFSSDLLRTEVIRAVRRAAPDLLWKCRELLLTVTLSDMPTAIFRSAAELDPTVLRSLDALHLAAALDLGDDLDSILTYDDRFAEAARSVGIAVVAPA